MNLEHFKGAEDREDDSDCRLTHFRLLNHLETHMAKGSRMNTQSDKSELYIIPHRLKDTCPECTRHTPGGNCLTIVIATGRKIKPAISETVEWIR